MYTNGTKTYQSLSIGHIAVIECFGPSLCFVKDTNGVYYQAITNFKSLFLKDCIQKNVCATNAKCVCFQLRQDEYLDSALHGQF